MCLKRSAHVLVPNHEVFQGPFPVAIETEDVPTPEHYRRFYDSKDLPDTMSVWHVETVDYTTADDLNPGTVSQGWGFEDSPDAEAIASGINSKGPHAVAMGRHGSLFLWGFACEPKRMTPSGRNAFLNAICYIQKHDHAKRLVEATGRDRRWALQKVAKSPEKLAALKADIEFLRLEGRGHVVDEDCKALGLSNRKLELLEHCIRGLESGQDVERCKRLLDRYTGEKFETAGDWRKWFDAPKEHLFFSDVGGYRWHVDLPATEGRSQREAPTDDDPVVAVARLDRSEVGVGDVVTVTVELEHAEGWHTYLSVPKGSAYVPTALTLDLPKGVTSVGGWALPRGVPLEEDPKVLSAEGLAVYRRRLRVTSDAAPGEIEVKVSVSYMACDEFQCLPPDEVEFVVKLRVSKD